MLDLKQNLMVMASQLNADGFNFDNEVAVLKLELEDWPDLVFEVSIASKNLLENEEVDVDIKEVEIELD